MKKIIVLYLIIFISSLVSAQIWEENLLKINNAPTIGQKFEAFENYREKNPYTKGNGYKPYAREIDFINERVTDKSSFKSNALYIEWEKQKINYKNAEKNSSANWVSIGPINTPINLSNNKKRGNGRVNCITFDPIDANIIWIGSPSGGLWKTIDGGSNWTTNTDNLPVMGISSIAIDPTNTQNMLIVTGDANGWDTYSIGILKSTDGGNTWNTTSLSYNVSQELRINKVIINPNNPDSAYAVTNNNIMISTDAGSSWAPIYIAGRWRDIEFKPGTPSTIYAAEQSSGGSNIHRSTDGGANWIQINNGMTGSGYRPLIAVTPDNPEVIYALFSGSDDEFHGLYKSSDSGENWALQSDSPNILGRNTNGTSTGGQSWYNLSLGVASNNEDLIYVGGINLWRSDNSGVNWDIDASSGTGNYSYMHVDQHAFEFNPHTHVAYAGNDGGLYKYIDNLNKWVDISDGLVISQFYNLGLSKSNPNRVVAGAQDNGTEMLTNTTWDAIMVGDGMECAIDHYVDDIIYAEYQYGGLRKSIDGGNNWQDIKPVNYDGGWNTPYEMHPINQFLIVIGYDEVYRSEDAGMSWDSISYNVSNAHSVRSIALAASDEDYIYAASYTNIKMTKNSGATWNNIKAGLPNYNITDIAVSRNNADIAWVSFSDYNNTHKVYETNDAGASWINISGNNLPSLPVNCIAHQGGANDDLYIGTDIGVYYKNSSMTDWAPFNTGLPNVIIKELEIHYDEGTISAATYGRGLWKSPLNTSSNVNNNNIEKINYVIYPNPAEDKVTVHSDVKNINVTIYNLTGQKVINTKSKIIDVIDLVKGCYIIEIKNGKEIKREKLIIK